MFIVNAGGKSPQASLDHYQANISLPYQTLGLPCTSVECAASTHCNVCWQKASALELYIQTEQDTQELNYREGVRSLERLRKIRQTESLSTKAE